MSANTKIEWADHTFNPWIGCTKVGPGCDNCYAKSEWDDRRHRAVWGAGQPRSLTKTWGDPVKWNKAHEAFFAEHGRRQRVFCASLADVFDNEVDPQWRVDLFELIRATPNLDWLLLTKRIGNAHGMMVETIEHALDMGSDSDFDLVPWPNVWIGATIVNQEEADRDIPKLLAVPAAKRFLSMEPLLGPVDLHLSLTTVEERLRVQREQAERPGELMRRNSRGDMLDWVIVGGESGPNARPMHPDWARSLRDQCLAAGVPFLFKQWGEWGEPDSIERTGIAHHGWFEEDREDGGVPRHHWTGPMVNGVELASMRPEVFRVGKKAAGRLLDGRTWGEVPA